MYWLQLVVIVALLAAVGWLAIGGGGHMSEPMPDRPDLALPDEGLLARTDVDRVRFSIGARGYRMDEVDDVLDRLAHEIELREQRITELEGRAPRPDTANEDEDRAATEDTDVEGGATEGGATEGVASETESAAAVSESGIASDGASEAVAASASGAVAASEPALESGSAESKNTANSGGTAPVQASPENEDTVE